MTGFSLFGDVCLSNFNYQISVTFNVDFAQFENNYLTFLNEVATAAGVGINNIVILSIVPGSVTVNMAITSFNPPGSQNAINAQNNLQTVVANGTSASGMPITASSVTTAGGSNGGGDSGSSGLSTTDIILMAVLIPVGVLRTNVFT